MKLTWHIVRKDLARLTIPLGLWLGFVVVTTIWFGVSTPPVYAETADLLGTWIGTLHGSGIAAVLLQSTVGALLAAVLVLEDRPTGTTAFWLTRPISGARLLATKFLGATLFLAVLPALALMIVWLAFGFTLRETGLAALEFAGWQLAVTLPALAVGATTGSLGRFVFVALGVWLLVTFTIVIGKDVTTAAPLRPEWADARGMTVGGILVLGAVLVFGRSHLGRRRPAWILGATTLVLMVVVRVAWKDEVASGTSAQVASDVAGPAPDRPPARAGSIAWERLVLRGNEPGLTMTTPAPAAGEVFLAPMAVVFRMPQATGGARAFELERGGQWGEAVARRMAGLAPAAGPLVWELGLDRARPLAEQLQGDPAVPPGEVRLAKMRARVLWELPLQAGAQARAGSAQSRIVNIGWSEGRAKRRIVLQERDARLAAEYGIQRNPGEPAARQRDECKADTFLLVNRSRGYARRLAVNEVGTARMNSVMLSARILEIEPAVPIGVEFARWDDGATILKVRMTKEGEGVYALPGGRVAVEKEKQP